MDWLRQLPMGQYVDGEAGWIRDLDVRIKFAWTLAFLTTPILANAPWRLGLVVLLLLLTAFSRLPWRLWRRTLPLLLVLSLLVASLALFLPAGQTVRQWAERPAGELNLLPPGTPSSSAGQAWQLWRWGPIGRPPLQVGPLVVTRASATLALNSGTLLFTLVHSANLLLLSTPPEALAWALTWSLTPLRWLGIQTEELGFMLLLSLRFMPLVQEEFQNLLRAVATRSVDFKTLGFKAGLGLVLAVGERLLANVLLRADQGADALLVRGGRLMSPLQLHPRPTTSHGAHLLALLLLAGLVILRHEVGGV